METREYLENLAATGIHIVVDRDGWHRDKYFRRKEMESVEYFSRCMKQNIFEQISQKLCLFLSLGEGGSKRNVCHRVEMPIFMFKTRDIENWSELKTFYFTPCSDSNRLRWIRAQNSTINSTTDSRQIWRMHSLIAYTLPLAIIEGTKRENVMRYFLVLSPIWYLHPEFVDL